MKKEKNTWEIDKTIHVSHIINVLSIVGSIVVFLLSYEHRITSTEVNMVNTQSQLIRLEDNVKQGFKGISEHLVRIEEKLDRKMDKSHK